MYPTPHRTPTRDDDLITRNDLPGHSPLPLSVQVTTEDDTQSRDQKISEAVDN